MAISDSQKIDYLWKKIGYAATKTDTAAIKDATNEAIPSPIQIRADKILTDSSLIPTTIPGANTGVVVVHTTSLPLETVNDATASTNRTWKTNLTDWISPEFGSTYQLKVYISPSGQANNVATKGTQVFATGSGNNDEWFFDYQSGVVHFIGTNLPSVSFTGNSVYVSGARYVGNFGLTGGAVTLGNISIANTTISSSSDITISTATNGNINLTAGTAGVVRITGNDAVSIPSGTTSSRPADALAGYIRYNTDINKFEYYNGAGWVNDSPSVMTSETIIPDGASNVFTLSANTTSTSLLVSINGTLQQPDNSYFVTNNQIRFTEVPLTSDIIEVRTIASQVTAVQSLSYGATKISATGANLEATGDLIPSVDDTYTLGSNSNRWKNVHAANSSVDSLTVSGNVVVSSRVAFTGWHIYESSNTLYFAFNGNVKMSLNSNGNLTVSGNVAGFGNP